MTTFSCFRLPAPKRMFRAVALVLTLAFTGCSGTDDPAPAAGVVTLKLTNNATWLGRSASVWLRDAPLRTPDTGKQVWGSALATGSFTINSLPKGARLYLGIQYNDVNSPNYLGPSQDEYIQAEMLVDGKRVAGVLLNANSFNASANYFPATPTRTNLMQEVEVML